MTGSDGFSVKTVRRNPAKLGAVTGSATFTSFWSSLLSMNMNTTDYECYRGCVYVRKLKIKQVVFQFAEGMEEESICAEREEDCCRTPHRQKETHTQHRHTTHRDRKTVKERKKHIHVTHTHDTYRQRHTHSENKRQKERKNTCNTHRQTHR